MDEPVKWNFSVNDFPKIPRKFHSRYHSMDIVTEYFSTTQTNNSLAIWRFKVLIHLSIRWLGREGTHMIDAGYILEGCRLAWHCNQRFWLPFQSPVTTCRHRLAVWALSWQWHCLSFKTSTETCGAKQTHNMNHV